MDWAPVAYQYLVGLIIVVIGVIAGFRTGTWGPGRWRWLVVMVVGWLLMLALQGGLQYWSSTG